MPSTGLNKLEPVWQDHLDFLLPRKEYLRGDEAAKALGVDPKTIDHLFGRNCAHKAPDLVGFDFVGRGSGQRPHKRVLRDSVLLLVATRANYTPAEFQARLVEVLTKRSLSELITLQGAIGELIRRKRA